jgi:hypothetical protein
MKALFFWGAFILSGILMIIPAHGSIQGDCKANGKTNNMPIRWEQAHHPLISKPDRDKLLKGEILCEIKKVDDNTVVAQSIGLIRARAEDCFEIIRNYNQYVKLMPHTVENKVIRTFHLDGEYNGVEAVDFWTRIRVFGFDTAYLLRIAHLSDLKKQLFRSFWTLVDNPAQLPACRDSEKRPCRNDLALNIGAHQFEPFAEHADYTLHTYTLTISGKNWWQQLAFKIGGKQSMGDVTASIRNAVEKRQETR